MLNQLINHGERKAQKGETAYKHVCFIVRGKTILSCEVNKYSDIICGRHSTFHAEESALLHNQHPKLREPSRRKRHTKAQGQRRFSRWAAETKVLQKPQRVLCWSEPLCVSLQTAERRMGTARL